MQYNSTPHKWSWMMYGLVLLATILIACMIGIGFYGYMLTRGRPNIPAGMIVQINDWEGCQIGAPISELEQVLHDKNITYLRKDDYLSFGFEEKTLPWEFPSRIGFRVLIDKDDKIDRIEVERMIFAP